MANIDRVLWQNELIEKIWKKKKTTIGVKSSFIIRLVGLEAIDQNVGQTFNLLKKNFLFVFGEKFTLSSLSFFKLKSAPVLFKKKKNTNLKIEFSSRSQYFSLDSLSAFERFFFRILFWKILSRYLRKKYRLHTGFFLKSKNLVWFDILVTNPVLLSEYLTFNNNVSGSNFTASNEILRMRIMCENTWIKKKLVELINEAT